MKPNLPVKGIKAMGFVLIFSLLSILSWAGTGPINNSAPIAMDDYSRLVSNTSIMDSYIANDYDPDGDSLVLNGYVIKITGPHTLVQSITTLAGGTLDLYIDGNFLYTPPMNFTGLDQAIYQICDVNPNSLCSTATIYLAVKPGNILPMNLLSFAGKRSGKDNLLQWVTAQENNSDHFELQYGTDNSSFNSIAFITAKGNSSVPSSYSYVHYAAAAPVNYYRLKMVDKDGRATYSKIVVITADGAAVVLQTVYPNPFIDKIDLAITTEHAGNIALRLYDVNGKTAARKEIMGVKGLNTITLDGLKTLQPGLYFIDVSGTIEILRTKLLKVN